MIPLSKRQASIRHFWLYLLKLEHGKYYVGITSYKDFMQRIKLHGGRQGASWTHKHKPLEIIEIRDLGTLQWHLAERREQEALEEYRKLYGIGNVRGGRVVSTGFIFKIGPGYFNRNMLEALLVLTLLMICGLYILFTAL